MSETEQRTTDQAAGEAGVNPGVRLAEARELLKISTTDIARQLKLSVAQVEALEAGHFDRLPGAVFVRGFIRNYARLVKLDPEVLLREARNSLPQQAPRPETPPSQDIPFPSARPSLWRKYGWMAAALIAALAFYEFFVSGEETVVTTHPVEVTPMGVSVAPSQRPEEEKAPPVETRQAEADEPPPAAPGATTDEPPAAAPTTAADAPVDEAPAPASPPVAAVPAPEPVAVGSAPERLDEPPVAAAVPEPKTTPPAPDPAERQVTLVFDDESWVEIRDRNGKVILWQLNQPGTRQVLSGLPPLSFVIGNAHGVRLTYDDRPVDLAPYTKTDVARMTLE